MIKTAIVGLALLGLAACPVEAVDHKNLDEGRPLRVEDAYPIGAGEIAVEAGAGFTVPRRGPTRGRFPIEILYGVLPNLQIGVGSSLSTDPRLMDDGPPSGDLRLGALYNFNQETISLPALALKLGLDAPTGVGATGYAVELKGIVTRSIERLSLHLNGGYELATATEDGERAGRYALVLGASYPVGAPTFTRATVVADVFAEQSARHREATTVGAEVGLRYQLTARLVWDVGLGTELAGPARRSSVFMTTGFAVGF